VERCTVGSFTDNGVFIYGEINQSGEPDTNANSCVVRDCWIFDGDGHGIRTAGRNSNAHVTSGNSIQNFLGGAAIYDHSYASNVHIGNLSEVNLRSYVSVSNNAETRWFGNYLEGSAGYKIAAYHLYISGQNPVAAAESTGVGFGLAANFGGWSRVPFLFKSYHGDWTFQRELGNSYTERVARIYPKPDPPDISYWVNEQYVDRDTDDPGGYFSRQWNDQYFIASEETTGERSIWGPNRKRFPQGFYLGHPRSGTIWMCTLNREPAAPPPTAGLAR
jgi:hypothetical protein